MTANKLDDWMKQYADGMLELGMTELNKDRHFVGIKALTEACELYLRLGLFQKVEECEKYLKVSEVYSGYSAEQYGRLQKEGISNIERCLRLRQNNKNFVRSRELDEFWKEL